MDTRVLETYGKVLGPIGLAVYCALAKFADNETRKSWPSHATIADLIGSSGRSVRRYIDVMCHYGLVRKTTRYAEDGSQTSNGYELMPPEKWTESPGGGTEGPGGVATEARGHGQSGRRTIPNELYSENYPLGVPRDERVHSSASGDQADVSSLKDHPAIRAVRSLTKRWPRKPLWHDLAKALGENPDSQLLAACYKEWMVRGYNPASVTWALDWYVRGGPPTPGKKPSVEPAEPDWMKLATREG